LPHHVTHRGNRCSDIFRETEDREIYLWLLQKHANQDGVSVCAYALMTNHVHLIVIPERDESLSDMIQNVHGAYATIFNGQYGLAGHLWQGRFFSCVLDTPHLWNAVRYVEQNPVRAGLVRRAEHFRWSSAASRCGMRNDRLLIVFRLRGSSRIGRRGWQQEIRRALTAISGPRLSPVVLVAQ
jgi:putative transposase